jgi:ribosomal RNA-processing protein 9
VRVWEAGGANPAALEAFVGHKDAVLSLVFRPNSRSLFSGGADRMLKSWSCESGVHGSHLETLFGHQAEVFDLDADPQGRERLLSAGGDRTARLWKVSERTQLLFRGGANVECVRSLWPAFGGEFFVAGGQDGSLSLWNAVFKRPLFVVPFAHGTGTQVPVASAGVCAQGSDGSSGALSRTTGLGEESLSGGYCNWITSIAVLQNSDLAATGSGDGFIRLWRVVMREPSSSPAASQSLLSGGGARRTAGPPLALEHVAGIPVRGVITGLAFSSADATGGGKFALLVASVGQEHRLGRWWRYRHAHNGICVVRIPT